MFIINPKGELRRAAGGGRTAGGCGEAVGASLAAINEIVHDVFPPLRVVSSAGEGGDGWGAGAPPPPPLPAPADGEGGVNPPPALLLPPVGREEFSSFSYWRAPPPVLEGLLPLGGEEDGKEAAAAGDAAAENGQEEAEKEVESVSAA